jgi:hypothetical protein
MVKRRVNGLPWASDEAAIYRNTHYQDLLREAWTKWVPNHGELNDGDGNCLFKDWDEFIKYIQDDVVPLM